MTNNQQSNIGTSSSAKDKRNNIIVGSLSGVLVILLVLFFMQRSEHMTIVKQMNNDKDSLQLKLSDMLTDYDSLKTENDTLNYNMELAKTRVQDLLTEVKQVKKASYDQITKLRNQIVTQQKIMRNFVVQIDSLNKRNKILLAENKEIKQQNISIRQEKKQLEKEKTKLQKTVAQAMVLEALNLKAEGITKSSRGTQKIRKIKRLRVSFTLSKNITAKRGNKAIYVRISRPDQVLLMKSKKDVFRFEDLKIPFSTKRVVEYEGTELPVNIYYTPSKGDLMKGKYTVNIFAGGNNIGTTQFTLK
ncbi:hypothetical protein EMN47_06440 [Prolixibacteraceae bacterium JC049]|nr:hypothetical protein [Prolixibacteraceae bacterium JC049]